jgi:hypothetical protein
MASDIRPLRNISDMGGEGGMRPRLAGTESPFGGISSQRQIEKSSTSESSPPSSENHSSPAASGSTLSQQSNDTNSTSIIGSSLSSLSCKTKKKRYATQHETRWLEEGQPSDPIPKQSSGLADQPLPTLAPKSQQIQPAAQPQSQTPPSVVSTVSPALSILGSGKYARMSPGQDAPAIQPGAPSAYLAAQPLNHSSLRTHNVQSEANNGDSLSAIDEEQTIRGRSVSPSPSAPQPELSKLRRGLSKLLRRNN